jgi:hypothetical protein
VVKKEGGVVRIEGGGVKKCKSVVKTLKTVVKINCIIWLRPVSIAPPLPHRAGERAKSSVGRKAITLKVRISLLHDLLPHGQVKRTKARAAVIRVQAVTSRQRADGQEPKILLMTEEPRRAVTLACPGPPGLLAKCEPGHGFPWPVT